jgi:hypothetical protein
MLYQILAEEGTWYLVTGDHWEEGASWPWHDCPAENARSWPAANDIVKMQCSYCGEAMSEKIITLWKLYSINRVGEWLRNTERFRGPHG